MSSDRFMGLLNNNDYHYYNTHEPSEAVLPQFATACVSAKSLSRGCVALGFNSTGIAWEQET
jgi:hypothetical protein